MRLVVLQPFFLPYGGVFEMLRLCDVWIDFDDVEGSRASWQVRNRIQSQVAQGWEWLTVPVSGRSHQPIRMIEVDDSTQWHQQHLRTIRAAYATSPGLREVIDLLDDVYQAQPQRLVEVTVPLLRSVSARLGLNTPVLTSSDLEVTGRRTERLLNLCALVGADRYLTGPAGLDYLDRAAFAAEGIELEVFDWQSPEPLQFDVPLSIIDLIARRGFEQAAALLHGTGRAVPVLDYLAQR